MKKLSVKWQKLIVWLTAYLNVIAFVIAGGYFYFNTENKEIRSSTKNALLLVAGFAGLEILRSVIYNTMSLFEANYVALNNVSKVATAIAIIKAIVFVVFFILDVCGHKLIYTEREDSNE